MPEEELDKFKTLMYAYHANALNHPEDSRAYDFVIPDNIRPYIKEHLPIFDKAHSPHRQEHLDAYLTNFYRQFRDRWNAEYVQLYNQIKDDPGVLAGIQSSSGQERGLQEQVTAIIQEARETNAALPKLLNKKTGEPIPEDDEGKSIVPEGVETERNKARKPVGSKGRDPRWVEQLRKQTERRIVEGFAHEEFQHIRNVFGPQKIDELLSEHVGRRTYDEAIATNVPPKPSGGTHIPITVSGILRDALIPSLPVRVQFPYDRFRQEVGQNATVKNENWLDEDGIDPKDPPTAWLWFREHEEALQAMADKAGYPLDYMLTTNGASIFDDTGRISSGRLKNWLDKNGFVHTPTKDVVGRYKGSTIPDQLVPKDDTPVPTSIIDLYRTGLEAMANQQKALLVRQRGEFGQPEYISVEGLTQKDKIQNISQTPEMQELLQRIYGDPRYGTSELTSEGMVLPSIESRDLNPEGVPREAFERELWEESGASPTELNQPQVSIDKEGNAYWDLSGTLVYQKENKNELDISRIYMRYKNFIDKFDLRYIDTSLDAEGVETGAEGQIKYFARKDSEGVERIYKNPDPFESDENAAMITRQRFNPFTQRWEKPEYKPVWQDDANAFAYLSDMYDLVMQLADVHDQLQIPLPGLLSRRTDRLIVDYASGLQGTLENFKSYPLDLDPKNPVINGRALKGYFPEDYFENQFKGVQPPTSAKDINIQLTGLRKYLDDHPLETKGKTKAQHEEAKQVDIAIRAYVADLEHAAERFKIPDPEFLSQIQLGTVGKQFALDNRIIDEDGTFLPFDDKGNVDDKVVDFIEPLMIRRRIDGQENHVLLSDNMLNNHNVIDPIPLDEREFGMQKPTLDLLNTLQEWGKQMAANGEDTPAIQAFSNLFEADGSPNYAAIRNVFQDQIVRSTDGREHLRLGRPHENLTSPERRPGILTWMHDQWDNYFDHPDAELAKPGYSQAQEFNWRNGKAINAYVNEGVQRIINKGDEELLVDVGDDDLPPQESPDEVPEWNKASYEEILDQIREGAVTPEALDDILKKPDGSWAFHLAGAEADPTKDEVNELQQLRDALIEGGHDNVEETVKSYDGGGKYTPPEPPPEPAQAAAQPEPAPNISKDPPPTVPPIKGISDEGTQMGFNMDINEENE